MTGIKATGNPTEPQAIAKTALKIGSLLVVYSTTNALELSFSIFPSGNASEKTMLAGTTLIRVNE